MKVNDDVYKTILSHYGSESQKMKAVEELTELAELLIKDLNGKEVYQKRVQEEIADVHIMLNQMLLAYGIRDSEIKDEINRKIKRTLCRMKAE